MNSSRLISFHKLVLFFTCFFASGALSLNFPSQVRRPPTIIKQPDEIVYAILKVGIQFECKADALPDVKESGPDGYYWKKDGKILEISKEAGSNDSSNSIIMSDKDGSITVNGSKEMELNELMQYEGQYQCFARNKWGTAISQVITLKLGTMVAYGVPENKVFEVNEGDPAVVPCRKSKENDTETRWELTPENTLPSNRIIQALDGTLVISNVADKDQGLEFNCAVKSLTTRSSIDGTHYTLSVNQDKPAEEREPKIIRPQVDNEERIVLRGDELKLICITVGYPTPTVYWTRNGKNLAEADEDRYEVRDYNRTLYIEEVQSSDEGEYSCMAMNEHGATTRSVNIIVQSRPYFPNEDKKPTDIVKVPGETATIKCNPEGTPPPSVQWMINGVPLDDIKEDSKRVILRDRIMVSNVNESDTAVYQCVGRNKHGVVMGQGFLNVMTSPPIPYPGNPTFYRIMEGNAVDMQCHVFGSPAPQYTWTKLDEREKALMLDSRITLKKNNALSITFTNIDDTGTYRCAAENEYGNHTIQAYLLVLRETVVRPREESNIYYAKKGDNVVMGVEVYNHPNLTLKSVEWYKDRDKWVVLGTNLELKLIGLKMEEGGIYRVVVKTDMDQAATTMELIVQDVPGPPVDPYFTANEADNYTGVLNWERPIFDNNAAIEGYMIEYQATKLKPEVWVPLVENIPGTETRADIAELNPWVSYSFRVWARNEVGWSAEPSAPTEPHQTPPKPPSINPTGVSGKGTAPDNMVITWDRVDPLKFAGPGFAYEVSWCLESSCNWTVKLIENASITSYTVLGRSPYTRHLINITSSNDEGKAQAPESVVGYSGEDVPLASPTIENYTIGDDSTITITWDPVPEDKMRGLVTGYQIAAANTDDETNDTDIQQFVEPNERRVQFELEPYTNYEFTVTATNGAGASEPSKVIRVMTPESVPEAPAKFRVTKRTLTSLELAWEEPEKKNGIILGYSLEHVWQDDGGIRKNSTDTTSLQIVLAGLQPDKTYYMALCANTSKGFGSDCARVSAETLAPEAPREPNYDVETNDILANVSWTTEEEDDVSVPAISFYVQHRSADEEKEGWTDSGLVLAEPERSLYLVTVRDLIPGTPYEFRVVAINDFGNATTNSTVYATSGSLKQVATGIVGQLWFIILMCIIALIVFIIVIVCFARRRKGGKYSVSEKEEQLVKLESQPMNNDEAGKYSVSSPNDEMVGGKNGGPGVVNEPLQSRRTRGDSVGGNSIEAFGSGDTRGFEEDGSFIDQYGVDRRSHGKSEGFSSPSSDETKDVSDAQSKLLPESQRGKN